MARIQRGLGGAVAAAGLIGPDGTPLRVVAHQLRHTWATELANAGMSMQALMTLLGHRSAEMTIRYARLASPVVAPGVEALGASEQQLADPIQRIDLAPTVAEGLSMKRGPVSTALLLLADHGPRAAIGRGVCSPIMTEPRSSLYRLLVGKDYVGGKLAPVAHLVLGPSRSH